MPCPSSLGVPGRVLEHRVPGPPGPEPLHLEEGSRWRTWLPTGLLALGPEQGPGCCVGPKGRSFLPLPEDALGTAGYRPGCCPPLPLPAAQLCLSVPQPRLCGVCSCSGSENRVLDPPPRQGHPPSFQGQGGGDHRAGRGRPGRCLPGGRGSFRPVSPQAHPKRSHVDLAEGVWREVGDRTSRRPLWRRGGWRGPPETRAPGASRGPAWSSPRRLRAPLPVSS